MKHWLNKNIEQRVQADSLRSQLNSMLGGRLRRIEEKEGYKMNNNSNNHKQYEELEAHFRKYFADSNSCKYWGDKVNYFICNHYINKKCKIDINNDPIFTGYPSKKDTDIMVIGEAPSRKGGKGIHISPFINEIKEERGSALYAIRDFCRENYRTIPYFTDLCKCGVLNQKEKKIKLAKRYENCFNAHLINEIEIIKPSVIITLGNNVYKKICEKKDYIKEKIGKKEIKIIQLMHYSNKASLPLTIEDKINIVWRYQIGKDFDTSKLSYFNPKENS